MPSKVTPISDARDVQKILNDLITGANKMDQIYVVTRDRDGNFETSLCGTSGGLALAIAFLEGHLRRFVDGN